MNDPAPEGLRGAPVAPAPEMADTAADRMAASDNRNRTGAAKKAAASAPPGRKLFLGYAIFGGIAILAGAGAAMVFPGAPMLVIGALEIGVGLWFLRIGAYGLVVGRAEQAVNRSLNLIGQGKLREAEALLDTVRDSRVRGVQRLALVQLALIALRRGDLRAAAAGCDAAVRVPLGMSSPVHEVLQRTNAHGIRAFVRASSNDAEGARSDIAQVKHDPNAPPQALARAALAEALLLEKAGERAALTSLLQRERRLLLDATDPRERAIVRGLQRLLRTPGASVYRRQAEPAKAASEAEEPALAEWMRAVAPDVAPFVESASAKATGDRAREGAKANDFARPSEAARARSKPIERPPRRLRRALGRPVHARRWRFWWCS